MRFFETPLWWLKLYGKTLHAWLHNKAIGDSHWTETDPDKYEQKSLQKLDWYMHVNLLGLVRDWRFANKGRPTAASVINWLRRYGQDVQDAASEFVRGNPQTYRDLDQRLSTSQIGLILGAAVAQMFVAEQDRIRRVVNDKRVGRWLPPPIEGTAHEIHHLPSPDRK